MSRIFIFDTDIVKCFGQETVERNYQVRNQQLSA